MSIPPAPSKGPPGPFRRAWRFAGSLRVAIVLLTTITVASVVGIILVQPESFNFNSYFNKRLHAASADALSAAEFVRLASAAGVTLGGEGIDSFVERAKAGRFRPNEPRRLFHRAFLPPEKLQKLSDADWRRLSADFRARATEGKLTREECERLALAAFIDLASAQKATDQCLRLSYVDSYGASLGWALLKLRIHKTFRSVWFRALCVLLVANLAACSCQRIPGQWRAAFGQRAGSDEPSWYQRRANSASAAHSGPVAEAAQALAAALRGQGFRVRQRAAAGGGAILEARRGWLGPLAGLGRLGSNVVHLGVVLVVFGGFVSGRLAFRHGQWASPGDVIAVPDVSYRLSPGYQLRRLWYDVRSAFSSKVTPPKPTLEDIAANREDWRERSLERPAEHGAPSGHEHRAHDQAALLAKTAFRLRVDDFDVRFTLGGTPEYYGAHVAVLGTDPPLEHAIEVNRPLAYRGFYVYQESYRPDYRSLKSVTLRVERVKRSGAPTRHGHGQAGDVEILDTFVIAVPLGRDTQVPGTDLTLRVLRYFPHWQIPLRRRDDGSVEAGEARNLSDELRNPAVEVRLAAPGVEPVERWSPLPFPGGRPRNAIDFGSFRVTPTGFDPGNTTGLKFKTHPVLWPVWLGCGVMMLGICLCFYCNHERAWALVRAREGGGSDVHLAGNAFKWRERFRERLDAVVAALGQTKG